MAHNAIAVCMLMQFHEFHILFKYMQVGGCRLLSIRSWLIIHMQVFVAMYTHRCKSSCTSSCMLDHHGNTIV